MRAVLFLGGFILSTYVAARGTHAFLDGEVDISIDLVSETDAPLTLKSFGDDPEFPPIAMEKIDPKFAPFVYQFELVRAPALKTQKLDWVYRYTFIGYPDLVDISEPTLDDLASGKIDRVAFEVLSFAPAIVYRPTFGIPFRMIAGEDATVSINLRRDRETIRSSWIHADPIRRGELGEFKVGPLARLGSSFIPISRTESLTPHFDRGHVFEISTTDTASIPLGVNIPSLADELNAVLQTKKKASRYYGRIPRRHFGRYGIELPGYKSEEVRRLFVGLVQSRSYNRPNFVSPPGSVEYTSRVEPTPGRVTTLDDWSPEIGADGLLRLPVPNSTPVRSALIFGLIFSVASGFLFLVYGGVRLTIGIWFWLLHVPEAKPLDQLKPFNIKEFLTYVLPLMGVWGAMLAITYPGGMSSDSVQQWSQVHNVLPLSDAHPVFNTLSILWITSIWDSPAAVVIYNIVLMSTSMAWGMSILRRLGVRPLWIALGLTTVLISPRNANLVIMLWKDPPFASTVMFYTVALTYSVVRPDLRTSQRYWLGLAMLAALVSLNRHNGQLITVGMWPILVVVYWPQRKLIFPFAFFVITLLFLYKAVLIPGLGLDRPGYFTLENNVLKVAPLINQDVAMSESEYEFLDRIRPMGNRWSYSPIRTSGHLWVDKGYAVTNLASFSEVTQSLLRRYPIISIRHFVRRKSPAFSPIPEEVGHGMRFGQFHDNMLLRDKVPPVFDLHPNSFFPATHERLIKLYKDSEAPIYSWLIWRPSIPLYLTIIGFITILVRTRDLRWGLPYLPVLMNSAAMLIVASPHFRYHLPLTFASSFLVCFALVPIKKRDASGDAEPPAASVEE